MLALSATAVLLAAALAVPADARNQNGTCSLPNSDTTPPFIDRCYHQGVWFSPHTPDLDVLLIPPQSAFALRDVEALNDVVDMWELGIKDLGAPWLASGLHVNDYMLGYEFVPPSALADPEIVVAITTEPFPPGSFLGAATIAPALLPCHGVQVPEAAQGLHRHGGDSPVGSFQAACAGGGMVCWVVNFSYYGATPNELRVLHDLIAHEVGHCLSLGHVGDADTEETDNSIAYPEHDIMSYESDGIHAPRSHCVSNLNVLVIEKAFATLLGQPGSTAVAPSANGYVHMYPDAWEAPVCRESDADFDDPAYVLGADPTREDTDAAAGGGGDGDAVVTILSPADGATLGDALTVTGQVSFEEEAAGFRASAGGPYSGVAGTPISITGSGSNGKAPYTCAWSGAGAAFDSATSCATTATFAAVGTPTLTVTVTDADGQADSADATVNVADPATVTCVQEPAFEAPTMWDLTKLCLSVQGANLVGILTVADLSAQQQNGCDESPATWGFWLTGRESGPVEVFCASGPGVANWAGDTYLETGTTATASIDHATSTITVRVPMAELTGLALPPTGWGETWNGPGAYGGRPMWLGGQVAGAPLYVDRLPDGILPTEMAPELPEPRPLGAGIEVVPLGEALPALPDLDLRDTLEGLEQLVVGPVSRGTTLTASDPSGETPLKFYDLRSVGIANEDGDSFDVVLTVEDLSVAVPSSPIASFDYHVRFCTDNNLAAGQPFCYRLTAFRDALAATFTGGVFQKNGGDVCVLEGLVTGGSFGTPANTIRWTVAKAELNVKANGQAAANCPPAGTIDRTGQVVQAGDHLTGLTGSTMTRLGTGGVAGVGTDTVGPDATYEFGASDAGPLGEHVLVTLGGLSAEVGVDSSAGPYEWEATFDDLSSLAEGTHVLRAVWYDAEGAELARDEVDTIVGSTGGGGGCNGSGSGPEDGGSANACLGNRAPQILEDTLELSETLLEEDGSDHDLVLSFSVRDPNRADHLDLSTLEVTFSPADEVTVDTAGASTEATDDETVLILHVPVTIGTGATVGDYGVDVGIRDRGVEGHPETILDDEASFAGVLELLPAGDLVVSIEDGDALDFGSPEPGASDVETANYFVVRNALHEDHDILLAIDDFANLEEEADCSDPEELDCIRVLDNLVAIVDLTPETDGSFTFADATEVLYTQEFEGLGELPDGASMGVKLRLLEVGNVHPGTYGSTFSVVEL